MNATSTASRIVRLVGIAAAVVMLLSVVSAGLSFQNSPQDLPPSFYRELGSNSSRLDENGRRLTTLEQHDAEYTKRITDLEKTTAHVDELINAISSTTQKLFVGLLSGIVLTLVRMYFTSKQAKANRMQVQSDIHSAIHSAMGVPPEPPMVDSSARYVVEKYRRRRAATISDPGDTQL
jgi:predicted PurR-regulated permease PerM